jgi:signal transduction histidine kinase
MPPGYYLAISIGQFYSFFLRLSLAQKNSSQFQMCDNKIVKLRITTLLIIGMTFLGLIVVLLGNLNAILIPFFRRQEESSAIANVLRAEAILEKAKQDLAQLTAYLANANPSMVYPHEGAQEWLSSVFSPAVFADLHLNLIAILDPATGAISGQFGTSGESPTEIPQIWENSLFTQPIILTLPSGQSNRVGYLKVESLLYLICIQSYQGSSLLLTGKALDEDILSTLANPLLFPMQIILIDRKNPPAGYADIIETLETANTPITRILAKDTIAGYTLLYGMDKSPLGLLEVNSNRTSWQGSQLVFNYLIIILVSAVAIFSLMTYLLVQFLILNRMTTLSKEVAAIGSNPYTSGRVTVTRRDELSSLAQNINGMLLSLEHARTDLEKSFSQVQAGRKRMEDLSRRLVTIQEEERHAIALELHDEIGQMLTGLKLKLANLSTPLDADGQEQLQQAQTMISDLIQKVRQLSLDLRPSMLDDLGLLPAVQWLVTQFFKQTGIQVNITHENIDGLRFPPEVEITAYRTIQEGLTNIARHAGVKKSEISLKGGGNRLSIQVADKGTGFNLKSILQQAESSGLSGIRERIAMLGGRFSIRSRPHQGTTLVAEIPVQGYLERRKHDRSHPSRR